MACWLFKSEPDEYSIADLQRDKTTVWNGIRNYQARNFLRDEVAVGDEILFYHSSCKPTAVAGLAEVVSGAYPDPSQFDPNSPYFDPKSKSEAPRWVCVDIAFKTAFPHPVTLDRIKATPALSDMLLVKQGRLSIQPVTQAQSEQVQLLANKN